MLAPGQPSGQPVESGFPSGPGGLLTRRRGLRHLDFEPHCGKLKVPSRNSNAIGLFLSQLAIGMRTLVSSHVPPLAGSYDFRLVVLSIAIAMVASYTALDLVGRVTSIGGRMRAVWLAGGAAAMGVGIWSMHYVGMLAFRLPVPVEYDWPTVLLSLLAAIFASAVALYVVSQEQMRFFQALLGGVLMGGAIAGMHYIGMAAMRASAMCHYSPLLVSLSVVLAVLISVAALWLAFYFRGETKSWSWQKGASALVMGAAIPVMHYTGMAAASFTPRPLSPQTLAHAVSISSVGITGIIFV